MRQNLQKPQKPKVQQFQFLHFALKHHLLDMEEPKPNRHLMCDLRILLSFFVLLTNV